MTNYQFCLLYKLYLLKIEIDDLEKVCDDIKEKAITSGVYDKVLYNTELYFKVSDKLEKHFKNTKEITKMLNMFAKSGGVT